MALLRDDASQIADAAELIRRVRWSEGVYCPHCSGRRIRRTGRQGPGSLLRCYHCTGCRRNFSDTTGTALQGTHVRLDAWLAVLHIHHRQPGRSGVSIARAVGLSPASTNRILRRARDCALCSDLVEYLNDNDPREERHQMLARYYVSRIDPPLDTGGDHEDL